MKKFNDVEIYDVLEVIEGDYLCTYFKICTDEIPIPHFELAYKELFFNK